MSQQPTVLIFDSGVGGLSVYQSIQQQQPHLRFIYLFDNAYFPYGEKTEEIITQRTLTLLKLIEKKHHLDLIIIACNTASTIVLPTLRQNFSMPIIGVVPAIKPAAQISRNKIIGLIATRATIRRSYIDTLIKQFAADCTVKLLGSSELVQMVEQVLHGEPIDKNRLKKIFSPWLNSTELPDTIVLGCTHFPLIKKQIQNIFPPGTQLIDSGEAIAKRVKELLRHTHIQKNRPTLAEGNIAYCTRLDGQEKKLIPVLQHYSFFIFKQLN